VLAIAVTALAEHPGTAGLTNSARRIVCWEISITGPIREAQLALSEGGFVIFAGGGASRIKGLADAVAKGDMLARLDDRKRAHSSMS
jgi:hypothetical protein